MFNYQFRWDTVFGSFHFLMYGLERTLLASSVSLVLAMIIGLIIALMVMSRQTGVRWLGLAIGDVIRNVPVLVQLLCAYYVLPVALGLPIAPFVALVIGLSLYQGAFISEVYRAGIGSIPAGQGEAAHVLGMSRTQILWRIVLPQAVRRMMGPLAGNYVQLIKFSSLGAVISFSEITRRGMELASNNFRPFETFAFVAFVYFAICWPITMTIRWWEARLRRR
jgi:polar amino acid transport system permease protein